MLRHGLTHDFLLGIIVFKCQGILGIRPLKLDFLDLRKGRFDCYGRSISQSYLENHRHVISISITAHIRLHPDRQRRLQHGHTGRSC